MLISAFLYPTGYHLGSWRHPESDPQAGFRFESYVEYARLADEAGLNFIFLPDSSAPQGGDEERLSLSTTQYVAQFEPVTLAASLAVNTTRVGIVATISTTYQHPVPVSRMTASVDLLSGGRFGWNVVTGQNRYEAALHGFTTQPSHADRYDRAEEFVDVVRDMWSTWRDGAPKPNVAEGRVFDPDHLHHVDYRGKYFRIRGRLNVPPSRQGRPVIVQAGASEAGIRLAARTADVAFVAAPTMQAALDYRRRMTAAARKHNRRPPHVLAGIMPIIGLDDADARASLAELDRLVPESLRLYVLQHQLGFSVEGLDVDGPLPSPKETEGAKGRQKLLVEMARSSGMTVRELATVVAASRGHFLTVGDAKQVADIMEEWFLAGACDGFFVMGASLPTSLRAFIEEVLPILTERDLFRPVEEGATLAQNLGLWEGKGT